MYEQIARELAESSSGKRYINERGACRYCDAADASAFGSRENAHVFPAALGNRVLFVLDECKACNSKFSIYEDALAKAVGPFLTFGGIQGRKGVRQTGRSAGKSRIRHSSHEEGRRLSVAVEGDPNKLFKADPSTGIINVRMPIEGDKFVPRYAYKALLKIAISMLPVAELPRFRKAIVCLDKKETVPHDGRLQVGFSYAVVGNAVPALAGFLLRRTDDKNPLPYMIFLFQAGSVCFQIWLKSDDGDADVPDVARLGYRFTAQLPKPEGGYFPIRFSDPLQFDWNAMEPTLQPFESFELNFDPQNNQGELVPIPR